MDTTLYEREVCDLLDATDTKVHHRVGFDQVSLILLSAGVWLYPTRFPEISCMSAMEAQAMGLVPLCTREAALAETVLPFASTLIPPLATLPKEGEATVEWVELAAKSLVQATKIKPNDPRRLELARQAYNAYNVDELARMWEEKLTATHPVLR
jgi:hypothetical protein